MIYLRDNDLQSAFRLRHSTETAVLKVMSDILLTLDTGTLNTVRPLGSI